MNLLRSLAKKVENIILGGTCDWPGCKTLYVEGERKTLYVEGEGNTWEVKFNMGGLVAAAVSRTPSRRDSFCVLEKGVQKSLKE